MSKIYAEEVNYWKTSKSGIDTWFDRIRGLINDIGGTVESEGFLTEHSQSGIMIRFNLDGQYYKLFWPALESESRDIKHERIQAITALYHEVKFLVVKWKFFGARHAFFNYLELPDGRAVAELGLPELENQLISLSGDRPKAIKSK